jgi:serine/threonine protein kinase
MFSRDPNNNKADQVIRSEVAILKKIYHPNIVRLIEIIED